jgi:hypothetical protein
MVTPLLRTALFFRFLIYFKANGETPTAGDAFCNFPVRVRQRVTCLGFDKYWKVTPMSHFLID